ncbi:hypothetical protein BKA82DRAFT_8969 [Pisolithus tinctorius]|uniref:Uncharacterized protein n=1 Tax=Pisolithus tinctorius Marx 270 TaxID=870435 RepID=A0A0C3K8K0_PISTI|nr:hypothetical protein BKA82DRAFT_8969 [Pisolithus tinctorius]KIO05887.1 hypothetical protein M404DRAFT_8969 [Pisolithus tinctorius Marx 270]
MAHTSEEPRGKSRDTPLESEPEDDLEEEGSYTMEGDDEEKEIPLASVEQDKEMEDNTHPTPMPIPGNKTPGNTNPPRAKKSQGTHNSIHPTQTIFMNLACPELTMLRSLFKEDHPKALLSVCMAINQNGVFCAIGPKSESARKLIANAAQQYHAKTYYDGNAHSILGPTWLHKKHFFSVEKWKRVANPKLSPLIEEVIHCTFFSTPGTVHHSKNFAAHNADWESIKEAIMTPGFNNQDSHLLQNLYEFKFDKRFDVNEK